MAFLNPAQTFRARFDEMMLPLQKLWNGTRAFFWRLALLAVMTAGLKIESAEAQAISHEYEIKAVFLFNFAQFTDWPTNTFADPAAPFVIGIFGNNPFGDTLEKTVQNEMISGRKFSVKYFSSLDEIKDCQILFIGRSEANHLPAILQSLNGRPVLTVSDLEGAARPGDCVRFITENNKIRLRINVDALKSARLVMSSKLLRVAELIPAGEK